MRGVSAATGADKGSLASRPGQEERERERDASALLTHLVTANPLGATRPDTSPTELLNTTRPLFIRSGSSPILPKSALKATQTTDPNNPIYRPKHPRWDANAKQTITINTCLVNPQAPQSHTDQSNPFMLAA